MRTLLLSSAIAVAAALVGGVANADDRAIAEQVFEEGRELMAAGRVAEACPKFAAAAKLSQTAGVRLNLADCYDRVGKTASAWAQANEALALAERAGDTAAADLARSQLVTLKPKLSYLTIAVANGGAVRGMEVSVDGAEIAEAAWGTPLPIDPGEHEIVAKAPGHTGWSTKASVGPTASRSTIAVPALVDDHATQSPEGRSFGATKTLAIVSGGLGLVGLGIGAGFGLDASSKKSQYQQHQMNGQCIDVACVTISKSAVDAATISTAAFVVGGLMTAAGIVLWLVPPGRDAGVPTVGVVPMAGPRDVSLGITGRF